MCSVAEEHSTKEPSGYDKKKEYIKSYYKRRYENDPVFREKENKRLAEMHRKRTENPEYQKKINEKAKLKRKEAKEAIAKLKELGISV